jgi:SNF2 family DNA or RNA helicase
MQIVDDKVLLVRTNNPSAILGEIKKSILLERADGTAKVAVFWGMKEARALAALGNDEVPSPILRDYKWTGRLTPFDHQKTTASFLTLYDRAFCFNEQGTGKTASVIWAADYLINRGEVKRVLVLCPLSIMESAWRQDLFKFAMHRSVSVAYGTSKQRAKIINAGSEFVVINFDGVAVIEQEIANGGFDLIVVDEANAYKNPTTNRWKVLNRIINATQPRLWMLTGTPAAQSPLDAFGLAKLVNPDNTPRYYTQYRDNVMYKVTQFKWASRPQAEQIVHKVLQPAIRFEKKDCLDLPEVTHVEREAPLTKQQFAFYKKLKTDMLFEAAGEEVSAVNAATKLNKLLQISGGAVYTDTGEVIEFDVSNRMNAVLEVIEEAANKVLVFVPFTHTIELLRARLEKDGISCAVINGKVPVARRGQIVDEFQTRKDPHVLLIQPAAASHGLTLTAADTIIWYAPVTSVETYLQANARINRPGQKNAMTIVHIRGSDVEAKLYHMLQSNIDNHEKIIDLYRQIVTTDT